MKDQLDCEIIRIDPDVKDFNEYDEVGQISSNYIIESTKKLAEESIKKSLIDKILKRVLELEFELNHSTKSKTLKYVVKKNTTIIIKHSNLLFKL